MAMNLEYIKLLISYYKLLLSIPGQNVTDKIFKNKLLKSKMVYIIHFFLLFYLEIQNIWNYRKHLIIYPECSGSSEELSESEFHKIEQHYRSFNTSVGIKSWDTCDEEENIWIIMRLISNSQSESNASMYRNCGWWSSLT